MFLLVLLLDVAKDDGHHYINSVTSKILHAFKLTGIFCPICRLCYSDDDWECKMIGCSTCDSWTHSKCENLPGKFYTQVGVSLSVTKYSPMNALGASLEKGRIMHPKVKKN